MTDYDVLVIGSGFGGSVTALRLTEKGYRVGVLEAGRRFTDGDAAQELLARCATSCGRRKLGCTGIQRIHLLKDCVILAGAGRRRRLAELREHALRAACSRSTTTRSGRTSPTGAPNSPRTTSRPRRCSASSPTRPSRRATSRCSASPSSSARPDTFHRTPVGVFFGRDGGTEPGSHVADPFFGGAGPERTGCIECGECMTGLPARRQEHPDHQLPLPRRAATVRTSTR